jgi:phytanoyl-CoA hydroxylase
MSERRRQFDRDGLLVLPGFASPEACAGLVAAAERIVAATDIDALETIFDAKGQGHGRDRWFLDSGPEVRAFLEDTPEGPKRVNKLGHALHDRVPEFRAFSDDPRLDALVRELGVAAPRLLQSMLIFKYPRVGGEVPAHQDASYLYTEPVSVIGLWFALEEATLANGCLEALPGSHRLGLRSRYRRDGDRAFTERLDPRPWPRDGWRPLPVPAGTLVVLHGLLAHRSAANRSPEPRRAYALHVIDAEAEYAADNWLQRPADMPLRGFSTPA